MLTREELNELKAVVRRAVEEEREMYDEVWLTAKELCKQFQMFTADWLKRYGQLLEPKQAVVTDLDGRKHRTSWVYPRNKIQRMIATGTIRQLHVKRTDIVMEGRVCGSVLVGA